MNSGTVCTIEVISHWKKHCCRAIGVALQGYCVVDVNTGLVMAVFIWCPWPHLIPESRSEVLLDCFNAGMAESSIATNF